MHSAFVISAAQAQSRPWEITAAPSALSRIAPESQVLERSSFCPGGCRYDRDGSGPEAAAANPWPDRSLYRGSGGEQVVFDERGAGAITRIWMTSGFGVSSCLDEAIRVRFYVDGATAPTLDLALPQLFDGSTAPFQPPLVRDRLGSSGGFVSYVPIAYAQGLRVALSDVSGTPNPCTGNNQHLLWYQITHHRLPANTPVTSFTPGANFAALANWFSVQGTDPWSGLLAMQPASQSIVPGQTVQLAQRSGSGWLRGLRLKLPRSAWAQLRLKIQVDGVDAVDLPLPAFFGTTADAVVPARAPLLGEDAAGWLYSWLPIPHRSSLRVQVVADAQMPAAVTLDSSLGFDAAPIPADAGRFFAESSSACGSADLPVFARGGAGRIVGVAANYRSYLTPGLAYLEGDERIYLDAAVAPQWYGTGLEDFYNGGFYFDQGAFATPWAGASRLDQDGMQQTRAWRWFATDPLTWQNAIRWGQEAGYAPSLPAPMCHDSVIYGYTRAAPTLVPYRQVQAGDTAQGSELPPAALCQSRSGYYADEPATPRSAVDCRHGDGFSILRLRPRDSALPLRLRRTAFAEQASAPAEIRHNGIVVGYLPYLPATPLRRWVEQDVVLSIAAPAAEYVLEIHPLYGAPGNADGFGESSWQLWGGWVDGIFADGSESLP